MALKIANIGRNPAGHEREIEELISMANASHRGRSLIRTLLDSFEVKGPEGIVSCVSTYEGATVDVSTALWR